MIVLISGSRDICNTDVLENALSESGFPIDLIVHGDARGVDRTAKSWANQNGIPSIEFKANWLEHGKKAGPIRNSEMITYVKKNCECGGALIAIWDGESKGTWNTIYSAYRAGLRVFIKTIITPGPENVCRRGKE